MNVLVIDDSAFIRFELKELIESIPGARVVGTAIDGVDGYSQALRHAPDVIMLDLEMPGMDGFTFLRLLGSVMATPVIVVSGCPWHDNAKRAFSLGAYDFIEKPVAGRGLEPMRHELERKLKLLPFKRPEGRPGPAGDVLSPAAPPEAVVIGASTGGPAAVSSVVKALPSGFAAAVCVSIHMPLWVTVPFVERLSAESDVEVRVARDGEAVSGSTVLVAPGGSHLLFARKGGQVHAVIQKRRRKDLYAPSIDRMFSSAAGVWGPALTGVVMTGLGSDGMRGVGAIKASGGYVIAESRDSAGVYGMPGAAVSTGMVDLVLSKTGIGEWIAGKVSGAKLKLA